MSFGAAKGGSDRRTSGFEPRWLFRTAGATFRAILAGAALSLLALPGAAKAPETSPKPVWRKAALAQPSPSPAPIQAADPKLPVDPFAGQIAALIAPDPVALAHTGKTAPVSGKPEVASAAVRPMPGILPGASAQALDRSPRPKWRPEGRSPAPAKAVEAVAVQATIPTSLLAVAVSPRPKFRPKGLAKALKPTEAPKVELASLRIAPPTPGPKIDPKLSKGGLCGIAGLTGSKLAPIAAGGCGIQDPVRLTSVNGVALSTPATMDCSAARALSSWVDRTLLPTIGKTGGGVKRIDVAGSYTCRPRNNQKGQKLSEHGRGKAIDITAIQLKNGSSLSVLHGWNQRGSGPLLKALHRGACGPFGTVLGPNANAFHRDHFHFDTASYRNGAYCK